MAGSQGFRLSIWVLVARKDELRGRGMRWGEGLFGMKHYSLIIINIIFG